MLQLRPPLLLKSWVESRMRLSLLFPRDFQNATYGQEEEFKPQYDHRPKKHDSSPTPYKTTQRERESNSRLFASRYYSQAMVILTKQKTDSP